MKFFAALIIVFLFSCMNIVLEEVRNSDDVTQLLGGYGKLREVVSFIALVGSIALWLFMATLVAKGL